MSTTHSIRPRSGNYLDPKNQPYPEIVGVLDGSTSWDEALEPGDLILSLGSKPLSAFIKRMDGFFSHTMIYIGNGEIAHAASGGVGSAKVTDIAADAKCVAMARPSLPEALRTSAAQWAAERTDRDVPIDYGAADLGQAFAILLRARILPSRRDAPDITEADLELVLDAELAAREERRRGGEEETSTCSGFAWRSYAEIEDSIPLLPSLVDGVLVGDDGRLRSVGETELSEQSRMNPLWFKPLPEATKMLLNTDRGALLSNAISPGDLWCSPTVGKRTFLTRAFAKAAGHDHL